MAGPGASRCRAAEPEFHGAGHRRWPRSARPPAWCSARTSSRGSRVHHVLYQLSLAQGPRARENPRAAVVFHWDHRHRQVRAEGRSSRSRTPKTMPISEPAVAKPSRCMGEPAERAGGIALRPCERGFDRRASFQHPLRRSGQRPSRRVLRRKFRGHRTGAAIGSTWTRSSCGSKVNFASTTERSSPGGWRTTDGHARFALVGDTLTATMNLLQGHDATCPHCWETINLTLDLSVPDQSYIEDCPVCCRPMLVSYSGRRR